MHPALANKVAYIPIAAWGGDRTGLSFYIGVLGTPICSDIFPPETWEEFVSECAVLQEDTIGAIKLEFDAEGKLEVLRDVTTELVEALCKVWLNGDRTDDPHPLAEDYVKYALDRETEDNRWPTAAEWRNAEGTW